MIGLNVSSINPPPPLTCHQVANTTPAFRAIHGFGLAILVVYGGLWKLALQ